MTVWDGFSFEMKLTLDGIMTLAAGVIAYVAAVRQIRHADRGLQRQLDDEKKTREDGASDEQRAVARALLFEIDDFYRAQIRDLSNLLEKEQEGAPPAVIKPMSNNPFPVYVGNASKLGVLPPSLVEAVVHYYAILQSYVATLVQHAQGYSMWVGGLNPQVGRALMQSIVPRIKSEARAITQLTFSTCGLLCTFTNTDFEFPRIGVAGDPKVQDDSRATLEAARRQLAVEMSSR